MNLQEALPKPNGMVSVVRVENREDEAADNRRRRGKRRISTRRME
ncbi:hypothetical protein HMPREF3293_00096 [Christensenella minuta]|uniref:Uncharacterized protein n=1 Tax=Christensenella minuta TaxID=626937 RepID=A0A136Q8W3_9FIRM|nr:hypothetical protein HMPREF3293_00096 [Christensenella minuta]